MPGTIARSATLETVRIPPLWLPGTLDIPKEARGMAVFAHGSGSSRFSPRNTYAASALRKAGFGTLLFDLLSEDEGALRTHVFNIQLLAERLTAATRWLAAERAVAGLPIGLFGASTGAAAALVAAAEAPELIRAVVSRGGRPNLARDALSRVKAPTLLIVGGDDFEALTLNRVAFAELRCIKALRIVPGATHPFDEPGALDQVMKLARDWLAAHAAEQEVKP